MQGNGKRILGLMKIGEKEKAITNRLLQDGTLVGPGNMKKGSDIF